MIAAEETIRREQQRIQETRKRVSQVCGGMKKHVYSILAKVYKRKKERKEVKPTTETRI